jgi:dCMP deaminase
MPRPTKDQWGLQLALVTAQRATCCRRSVGCVLVNSRGHVLATGYNGRAAGLPHCNEWKETPLRPQGDYIYACAAAHAPSGTQLDGCEAIHAEQNALLQCRDVYSIHTAYVTASPCVTCVKLLLNTSCERVVFATEYSHVEAKELWRRGRRDLAAWVHMPLG